MVIYTKYTYYIINTIVNIEICINNIAHYTFCLLYTSDAADE